MAHREYRDEQDVVWQVWDIHPLEVAQDRPIGADSAEPPTAAPTRTHMAVSHELVGGWLCFESNHEKRRLWPIPAGWEQLGDLELTALCAAAVPAPPRKPRLMSGRSQSQS